MGTESWINEIERYHQILPLVNLFLGPKCSSFQLRLLILPAFVIPSPFSPIMIPLSFINKILTAFSCSLVNGSMKDPVILNQNSSWTLVDGIPPWFMRVWSHIKLDTLSGSKPSGRASLLIPDICFILSLQSPRCCLVLVNRDLKVSPSQAWSFILSAGTPAAS